MMRNTRQRSMGPIALMLLFEVVASIAASEEGIAPGAAPSGYLLLGSNGDNILSIITGPMGANLPLQKGSAATGLDSITISVDSAAWKLTVEDANAASSTYDGKMRRGSYDSGATEWSYDRSEQPLSHNLAVLVSGIGNNNGLPETVNLTDCSNLASPKVIASGNGESTNLTIAIKYSQFAASGDVEGAYRIGLTYTLSSNDV